MTEADSDLIHQLTHSNYDWATQIYLTKGSMEGVDVSKNKKMFDNVFYTVIKSQDPPESARLIWQAIFAPATHFFQDPTNGLIFSANGDVSYSLLEAEESLKQFYRRFQFKRDKLADRTQFLNEAWDYRDPFKESMNRVSPMSKEQFMFTYPDFDPSKFVDLMFGNKDPFIQKLWDLHMVNLLRRVKKPGANLDSMVILISPEKGRGKTRFLEALGRESYCLIEGDLNSKENSRNFINKFIVNFDECDSLLKGKCAASTKTFITKKSDILDQKYLTAKEFPRSFGLFGTSNDKNIIQDLDGDRRFYPITIHQPIPVSRLEDELFWSYLMGYYKQLAADGFERFLNAADQAHLESNIQKDFRKTSALTETLPEFLEQLSGLAFTSHTLYQAIKASCELKDFSYSQKPIESILKAEGFVLNTARLAGGSSTSKALWRKTEKPQRISPADLTNLFLNYFNN
jgi:hypothetical protein